MKSLRKIILKTITLVNTYEDTSCKVIAEAKDIFYEQI